MRSASQSKSYVGGQRVARTATCEEEDDPDEFSAKHALVEKTAIEDARFVQTDGDKEKLRERFTLDSTLTRYSRWRKIRMDFFVHGSLIVVSQLYISLIGMLTTVSALKARQDLSRQTPLCWCDNSYTTAEVNAYLAEVRPEGRSQTVLKAGFLLVGCSSVLWERLLSRRSALLIALSLSLLSVALIHQTGNRLARNIAWTIEYSMSGAVHLLAYTSFVEVLPKRWRVVGAGIAQLASTFSDWLALTSIHAFSNIDYLWIIFAERVFGLSCAILFVKESISHLIVQGRYTDVDNILHDEEIELNRKKTKKKKKTAKEDSSSESTGTSTEGDIPAELKQARMITDDLAYRDDEDYTPLEFIRKLPTSDVFYILCATFAIAALSGVLDRMTMVYLGQLYVEGEILLSIKLLIKTLSGFVLMFHRKWHRCRSMILLLAIAVFTMGVKLVAVRLQTNACSYRPRISEAQLVFGLVCICVFHLTVEMLRALSLLYVAELTPSSLRMSAVTLVIFVNSISRELSEVWNNEDLFKSLFMCVFASVILCFMLRRKVTDSPEIFCIYMNDLVPKPRELADLDTTPDDEEDWQPSNRDDATDKI